MACGSGHSCVARAHTSAAIQTTIASGKLGGEIIRKEGLGVLTKGMGVFSFKRFCDWTTRYLFVEIVQSAYRVRDSLWAHMDRKELALNTHVPNRETTRGH